MESIHGFKIKKAPQSPEYFYNFYSSNIRMGSIDADAKRIEFTNSGQSLGIQELESLIQLVNELNKRHS